MAGYFEGDNSYALSQEEIKALYQKFRIYNPRNDPETFNKQVTLLNQTIRTLNTTPTGARALRTILNSKKETIDIDLSENTSNRLPRNFMGGFSYANKRVYVRPEIFNSDHGAVTFVHECLHAVQDNRTGFFSTVAAEVNDAETQALDMQLYAELGVSSLSEYEKSLNIDNLVNQYGNTPKAVNVFHNTLERAEKQNSNYKNIYEQNYQKWLRIAKNPKNTPEGIPPFKPQKGVNLAEAQQAYARQMASLETQAECIKEFVTRPHQESVGEGRFLMDVANTYNAQNSELPRLFKDKQVPKEFIDDAIRRNPFLRQEDFNVARAAHGEDLVYSENAQPSESKGFGSWFRNSWFGRLIGINDKPSEIAGSNAQNQAPSSSTQPEAQTQPSQPEAERGPSDARRTLANAGTRYQEQRDVSQQRDGSSRS